MPGEGWNRDEELVASLRAVIADYRSAHVSLATLVDVFAESFRAGSPRLRSIGAALQEPIAFLEAVVASGSDHSTAVDRALQEIDAALRRAIEQDAA
jgi:hypothetical protein